MITMLEHDMLGLYHARSAELIAAAERDRLIRRRPATPEADRIRRWRVRLPRWFTVDITLRVSASSPSTTHRAR